MATLKLDPAPTDEQYRVWARTATRPATAPPFGQPSAVRRQRDARLSARVAGYERPRPGVIRSRWTGRTYVLRG